MISEASIAKSGPTAAREARPGQRFELDFGEDVRFRRDANLVDDDFVGALDGHRHDAFVTYGGAAVQDRGQPIRVQRGRRMRRGLLRERCRGHIQNVLDCAREFQRVPSPRQWMNHTFGWVSM